MPARWKGRVSLEGIFVENNSNHTWINGRQLFGVGFKDFPISIELFRVVQRPSWWLKAQKTSPTPASWSIGNGTNWSAPLEIILPIVVKRVIKIWCYRAGTLLLSVSASPMLPCPLQCSRTIFIIHPFNIHVKDLLIRSPSLNWGFRILYYFRFVIWHSAAKIVFHLIFNAITSFSYRFRARTNNTYTHTPTSQSRWETVGPHICQIELLLHTHTHTNAMHVNYVNYAWKYIFSFVCRVGFGEYLILVRRVNLPEQFPGLYCATAIEKSIQI